MTRRAIRLACGWVALTLASALAPVGAVAMAAAAPPALAGASPGDRPGAGDAQSDFDRGIDLLCGSRGPNDLAQAAAAMARAAERGHRGAQSVLGWMHMTGTGVAADDARAATWLRKAAQRGDAAAQNNLGVLYATGQGVAHDHAQAERWFGAAARRGAVEARRNLAALRAGGDMRRPAGPPDRQAVLATAHCTTGDAPR